jgi:PAS domain S-box-containing protein
MVWKRFFSSLRFKMTFGVILILLVVMSAVFLVQYTWFRREMIERLGLSATPLSDVIKGSLKHAMATRNLDEINHIVANVSKQKGVIKIFVVDKQGVIRISPLAEDRGRRLTLDEATCQICHRVQAENRNKTVIFKADGGERIFRNVNPIANEPECYGCHGSRDRLIGVLISDFSMTEVDQRLASKFWEMLVSLVTTILVTVATISFTMNRLIIGRLERFVRATKLLGRGRLDQEVQPEGPDEIGELAASFNEMLENLRRATEIRQRKELLENVLETVKESIIVYDPEGRILSFSRGAEETFRVSAAEVLGKPYAILGDERGEIFQRVQAGSFTAGQVRLRSRDGRYFPALVSIVPLRNERHELLAFVEITRDLTEERLKERLQQQLMQSEKLAATGQLAAGVAHELNNPLGNILLYGKLLLEELEPTDPRAPNLQHIAENTLRCKRIVKSLLDYAKESEVHMTLQDFNDIAETSAQMLGNEMRLRDITCELRLAPDLPRVPCDRNQVQQVLINLIQNAIQAVEDRGQIRVATVSGDDRRAVRITVTDNGPGIPPEALSRIFEPFFTTKPSGTGLGLSICYGIVERHHGRIWVESPVAGNGAGAAFTVELPAG